MLRKLSLLFVVCIAFAACKDKSKFVIEGTFTNTVPQSKVYLFSLQKESSLPIDSTVFSEKGEFKFEQSTPGVDFFKIAAGTNEYMVIVKNGDVIKITADLTDKNLAYNISGATEADKLQELNTIKNQYIGRITEIQTQFD
ncbi:MAG: DUF4369 domain-containing protein, partial [Pedobacter sp.]